MNYSDVLTECINQRREMYPLTPSQMGIYLACVQNPQGTMYNTPCSCQFRKGKINVDRLILAIQKSVLNHEVLRAYTL